MKKTSLKPIETKKLEDIIKQSKYYYVNSDITTAHFPIPDIIETENWKIITIDKTMTSEEVLAKIKAEGCRPANAYELATWANNHREEVPKGTWYVAFGQLWQDSARGHRVPHVHAYSDGDFYFELGCFGPVWHDDYAFFCFCDTDLGHSDAQTALIPLTLQSAIDTVKAAGYTIVKII